ncbi:hypothetical protein CHU98_g1076 [Xylaria longipes]|nr:hypothetical protein CHU98_g1076 [Xylaria longipes]
MKSGMSRLTKRLDPDRDPSLDKVREFEAGMLEGEVITSNDESAEEGKIIKISTDNEAANAHVDFHRA